MLLYVILATVASAAAMAWFQAANAATVGYAMLSSGDLRPTRWWSIDKLNRSALAKATSACRT